MIAWLWEMTQLLIEISLDKEHLMRESVQKMIFVVLYTQIALASWFE